MDRARIEGMKEWPIGKFREFFASLAPLDPGTLEGTFHRIYVGPRWVRAAAPRLMFLGGLQGWWGKEFCGGGRAFNLVQQGGRVTRSVPMILEGRSSRLDGRPTATLTYPKDAGVVVRLLRDELKEIEPGALLGMSFGRFRGGERAPLPFVLERREIA